MAMTTSLSVSVYYGKTRLAYPTILGNIKKQYSVKTIQCIVYLRNAWFVIYLINHEWTLLELCLSPLILGPRPSSLKEMFLIPKIRWCVRVCVEAHFLREVRREYFWIHSFSVSGMELYVHKFTPLHVVTY